MKKLLVLDLDETLMHACLPSERSLYTRRGINLDDADFDILDTYPTFERPGVHNFLGYAFDNFDVGVWTSAGAGYAEDVIDKLFLYNGHPEPLFVYSVDNCVRFRPMMSPGAWDMPYADPYRIEYIKDLRKLKKFGYKLEHTIAIDDTPSKFRRQYSNLVRVPEFTGDMSDDVFPKLEKYLTYLNELDNIRPIEKRRWIDFGKYE